MEHEYGRADERRRVRSRARTIVPVAPSPAAVKNSPRVTPRVLAIFCIDPMDGETSPFSSWEMKLAENPVRVPRARADIPGEP